MNVLIISWSGDNESVALVTKAIEAKGGKAYRFDTDLYPTQLMMSAGYEGNKRTLRLKGEQMDLDLAQDIDAIWYRRLRIGQEIPQEINKQLYMASVEESKKTFAGMLGSMKKFTLDPYHKVRHTENKQLQLQIAAELGLDIPRTLFTNDAEAVKEFYHRVKAPLITKMQHSFAVYDKEGRENVVFTNEITEEHLEDLEGLDVCPMTFQEKVDKKVELRITIVGDQVFAAAVDSSVSELSKTDWRRDGVGLENAWKPYNLPPEVEAKLLKLMDELGLNYGAADVIVTHDERYVFLEVNPAGEFFWLDKLFDRQISEALANVLLDKAPRRTNNIQMLAEA
ncbi:MvdD family ATP-grasp ribosomal peptide maturase [Microscilla marina]|uniref:ATP-grasp domain-containing protein n=1 Tax=Microscilla marina ATCC 23134 TaxID=313606 RepID=A1ZXI5_MICM2|nr:MvdD family ATP-grasp ribosomal peptide maturase [Microscilla marina]EAY24953.1 conserved hypothetical protein [Microscilla marina ATCC 23134]